MILIEAIKRKLQDVRHSYYKDIGDMPMWNWAQVHEQRDTKYCLIAKDYTRTIETLRSQDAFNFLMEQFFKEFGFHTEYIQFMKDQRRILMKRIDAYLTGNMTLLTFAEIDELMLKKKYERIGNQTNFQEMVIHLEQEVKIRINIKEISVREFYTHMKVNSERSKKLKEMYSKWQKR